MKAILETLEPVIRPTATKSAAKLVRSPVRPLVLATLPAPALFHAWRA